MKDGSFGVITYTICYIIAVLIYCSPRVLAEFSSFDVSHINENFEFPLEIFSWGLLAVCSSYSGIDFGKNKLKANIVLQGQEQKKNNVFLVVVLLLVILFESSIFNYFLGHDFVVFTDNGKQLFSGIKLPLDSIATALVITITIMLSGNQISFAGEKNEETN